MISAPASTGISEPTASATWAAVEAITRHLVGCYRTWSEAVSVIPPRVAVSE
jgi:hypothetical protein